MDLEFRVIASFEKRGRNTGQNGEKRLRVGKRTNYESNPNQPSTKNLVGEVLESL